MKKVIIGISGVLMLCGACKTQEHAQLIGGEKDRHGCLTAAGYTWSKLYRDCIRVFDMGVRIEDPSNQPELSSYAVFSADSSRVEVFRPSSKKSVILQREGDKWTHKTCRLMRNNNRWVLENR